MKYLGATPPFLYFKKCDVSSKIRKKRPSQTPAVAPFRDRYVPTSKKYVSTEAKRRSLTSKGNEICRCYSSFLYFKTYDISSQSQEKRPSQTPAVAPFRDTYGPTSRK